MTTTRRFQLWVTVLFSITLLSFERGKNACDPSKCTSNCKPLWNCSNVHNCCNMECSENERHCNNDTCDLICCGDKCKTQKCEDQVKQCTMQLLCSGKDCKQTCKAKEKCQLECCGGGCKIQKCEDQVEQCTMHLLGCKKDCEQTCKAKKKCQLECCGGGCKIQKCGDQVEQCTMHLPVCEKDCEQTCKAKKECKLKCSGGRCKIQKCEDQVEKCTMRLGCSSNYCEQICKAKTCDMECSGGRCTKQLCEKGNACNMHCDADYCSQRCTADECRMTRTWPISSRDKLVCSGNGICCGSLMSSYNTPPLSTIIYETCTSQGTCTCTKYANSIYSTSNLYTSNIVMCNGILPFATKPSAGKGTETYAPRQSSTQPPLSIISPSPFPSPSSQSSSATVLLAEASSSPTLKSLLLSNLATAISEGASSATASSVSSPSLSSPAASTSSPVVEATSSATASSLSSTSLSSPAASASALSPIAEAVSSATASSLSSSSLSSSTASASASSPVEAAAETTAVSSSSMPSPSLSPLLVMMTTAASSSTYPSQGTPPSSTVEAVKNLAKKYFSELGGIEISGISSLMAAIRLFEDFITSIQTIPKPLSKEEIDMIRKSTFEVAAALEEFALNYGKYQLIGKNSSVKIDNHTLVLAIQKVYRQNASDFYHGEQEIQRSISLSSANFVNNVSVVVRILYKDLHGVLFTDRPFIIKTGNTRYLNSEIKAVAMDPKPEKSQENVILKFRNLNVHEGERNCMFWNGSNESSGGFSERGCYIVASESNSEETVCSCDHLTHFAVLVDYNGSPGLTAEDETILEIVTYVGLSLSLLGILLTIILYSFLTDIWQPLSQIRLSLSVALGAGQITFLAGVNGTGNTASCITAAVFLQYFLMAAFCWMLVEGIYFYLLLVKVYNVNTKMHLYHVISWGMPVIMVVISLSIASGRDGIQSFTSEKYCWLSSTNNLIWIFVTFVAFIEVLNILIIARVVKEMSTLIQPTGRDNHMQQIRLGIKTCAVMIPLLGVTWVFGLLLPSHKAFAYIFTIFNSTQGILIFLLHCVRNSQIRERLKRKMSVICPSAADQGNSVKKTSQVNPSSVGNVWAVKMQSFKE